jgi:hypothetical protein|tara:strand:- start:29 stop:133 length:105 start_codon:yes stop_codon:yes gene_type:complete
MGYLEEWLLEYEMEEQRSDEHESLTTINKEAQYA